MEPTYKEFWMQLTAKHRFYVLDEAYHLVLACPASPDDPLNAMYDAHSAADALPPGVESIVRTLTLGWDRDENPADATASFSGLSVTVSPLQGPAGRHIAVRIVGHAPEWSYGASA